jgi:hypothetical protein
MFWPQSSQGRNARWDNSGSSHSPLIYTFCPASNAAIYSELKSISSLRLIKNSRHNAEGLLRATWSGLCAIEFDCDALMRARFAAAHCVPDRLLNQGGGLFECGQIPEELLKAVLYCNLWCLMSCRPSKAPHVLQDAIYIWRALSKQIPMRTDMKYMYQPVSSHSDRGKQFALWSLLDYCMCKCSLWYQLLRNLSYMPIFHTGQRTPVNCPPVCLCRARILFCVPKVCSMINHSRLMQAIIILWYWPLTHDFKATPRPHVITASLSPEKTSMLGWCGKKKNIL